MDTPQELAQILLTTPPVQLCRVEQDLTELLEFNEMIFAKLPNGQVFFTIGNHFYTLQKSLPIYLTSYETQRSYCYSFLGEVYSIILQNDSAGLIFPNIDDIFDKYSLLIYKDRQGRLFDQESKQEKENISAWQYLSKGVSSVGSVVSKGLVQSGQFAAEGISSIGNYVEKKITPSSEGIKLSDDTKSKFQAVKDVSGKAIQVSAAMAKQIVEMNIQLARMMSNTVEQIMNVDKQNKPEEEIKQSKDGSNQQMKEFAQTSVKVTLEILDSLDKAATTVGKALGQTVGKVIEKKYGKEASSVCKDGVDIVDQINQNYRDIRKAETKALLTGAAKETVKQIGDKL